MGYIKESFNLLKLMGSLCLRCTVLGLTVSAIIFGVYYFTAYEHDTAEDYVQSSIDDALETKQKLLDDVMNLNVEPNIDAGNHEQQ
tara:strand:+ start:435 stop:692 length:258 start_codon:yes stop_codon:yes gene_type:complete